MCSWCKKKLKAELSDFIKPKLYNLLPSNIIWQQADKNCRNQMLHKDSDRVSTCLENFVEMVQNRCIKTKLISSNGGMLNDLWLVNLRSKGE